MLNLIILDASWSSGMEFNIFIKKKIISTFNELNLIELNARGNRKIIKKIDSKNKFFN